MAVVLGATSGGTLKCGPGEAIRRIRQGEEVVWNWPVDGPPEGDDEIEDLTERWRAAPPKWPVLRTIGAAELAERAAALPKNSLDDLRGAATNENKVLESERGTGKRDQEMIRTAYAAVDTDIAENVSRGKPKVEAVRLEMEALLFEETGQKKYPSWLTQRVIDAALEGKD